MTEANEALKKAAEEIAQGLAGDEPLVAIPKSRNNTGGAMRMDTFARLLEALHGIDERHFWAAFDIALGWKMRDNPARLKTAQRLFGHVGGSGVQEASDYMANIDKRYCEWLRWTAIRRLIDCRQIAIGICGQGMTFKDAAFGYGIDQRTAKARAIKGVEAFVEANARDVKREVHPKIYQSKPKEPRMLKVTRIVKIIEDFS